MLTPQGTTLTCVCPHAASCPGWHPAPSLLEPLRTEASLLLQDHTLPPLLHPAPRRGQAVIFLACLPLAQWKTAELPLSGHPLGVPQAPDTELSADCSAEAASASQRGLGDVKHAGTDAAASTRPSWAKPSTPANTGRPGTPLWTTNALFPISLQLPFPVGEAGTETEVPLSPVVPPSSGQLCNGHAPGHSRMLLGHVERRGHLWMGALLDKRFRSARAARARITLAHSPGFW